MPTGHTNIYGELARVRFDRRTHALCLDVKYVSTVSVSGLETDCSSTVSGARYSPYIVLLFLTVSERGPETLYLAVSVDLSHCFYHVGVGASRMHVREHRVNTALTLHKHLCESE